MIAVVVLLDVLTLKVAKEAVENLNIHVLPTGQEQK